MSEISINFRNRDINVKAHFDDSNLKDGDDYEGCPLVIESCEDTDTGEPIPVEELAECHFKIREELYGLLGLPMTDIKFHKWKEDMASEKQPDYEEA